MACDSSCACSTPKRSVRPTHYIETIIGPVFVLGHDSERGDHDEREKALEKLAKDDAFWLRLWETGINHVRLEV